MKKHFIIILSLCCSLSSIAQQHRLWYSRPATSWVEALPIGNSHLGAMVYGDTDTETIQLNEETFWSGSPYNNNSKTALEHLQEVRQLIFDGKEKEAHKLLDQHFVPGPYGMRYLPLGNVRLKMGHANATTTATIYAHQIASAKAKAGEVRSSIFKRKRDEEE